MTDAVLMFREIEFDNVHDIVVAVRDVREALQRFCGRERAGEFDDKDLQVLLDGGYRDVFDMRVAS
eukprot:7153-Eustigmatos_ZCMA.PRE.1